MTAAISTVNPYPGLRPYEADEAHLFFGRDQQTDELLRRLRLNRFLAVVGTSGSGKSSLVRAGLVPALYGGFMADAGSIWRIAVMKPGAEPVANLARALAEAVGTQNNPHSVGTEDVDPAVFIETTLRRGPLGLVELAGHAKLDAREHLLVIVDQFEEVFRFRSTSSGRQDDGAAMVKLLLEASKQQELPIYVMLTMRSDFLGECPRFRGLPEAINDGLYLVPRLTRDQIRDAIVGPARVGGADVAPRLVQRLLSEVGEDPDQLPQLQHALMRSWEEREAAGETGELDSPHYEKTGGVAQALSLHADQIYQQLTSNRLRGIVRKLFQQLTEKGEGYRDVRRPTTFEKLCAAAEANADEVRGVADMFRGEGRSFLIPPLTVPLKTGTVLDISHESLIRVWSRLQEWVDQEARAATQWKRLAQTSELHERGLASFLSGLELAGTLEWWNSWSPNCAWAERYYSEFEAVRRFLIDSERAHQENEAREKERSRLEAERRVTAFFDRANTEETNAIQELLSRLVNSDGKTFSPAVATDEQFSKKWAENPPPFLAVRNASGSRPVFELVEPEVFFSGWPVARKWLVEDRELMELRREMAVILSAWETAGRGCAHTLTGTLLERAVEMRRAYPDRFDAVENEFIKKSRNSAVDSRPWIAGGWAAAVLCLIHAALIIHSAMLNYPYHDTVRNEEGVLDRAALAEVTQFLSNGPPLTRRWDWFPWEPTYKRIRSAYVSKFRKDYYEPAKAVIVAALQSLRATPSPTSDFRQPYENLKAYLMMTSMPERIEPSFLESVLFEAWRSTRALDPETSEAARRHFAEIVRFKEWPYSESAKTDAVEMARRYLKSFSVNDRGYQSLLANAGAALQPVRFYEFSPGSHAYLSVTAEVPASFRGADGGWKKTVAVLERGRDLIQDESWVYGGDISTALIHPGYFREGVQKRYITDCIGVWANFLDSARVQPFTSLSDAASKIRVMSGPQSPLRQLFSLVGKNTNVYTQELKDAFQPVQVPTEAYFDSLSKLAVAVEGATGGGQAAFAMALAATREFLALVSQLPAQFNPSADARVSSAVIRLLSEPGHDVHRLLQRGK